MGSGSRKTEQEELARTVAQASQDVVERVRELRETVRAQQFRINQLEESLNRQANRSPAARTGLASTTEHRYLIEELEELRRLFHRLEMRVEEQADGMRWLYERFNELREYTGAGSIRAVFPPARAGSSDGAPRPGDAPDTPNSDVP